MRKVMYSLVCDIANSVEIDFICVYKREEIRHVPYSHGGVLRVR